MVGKLAAVAIGGNSLILDPKRPDVSHQWEAVDETCKHIASMIAEGWNVIVTHGNGPQVGYILRRSELAAHEVHTTPLDLIVADTQGAIGYMLQQSLDNELRRLGINRTILTVVTQVRVDPEDPAFKKPTKPIGGFMTEEEARKYEAEGWNVVEDAGRGWRRVVASPKPLAIQEINAIRALIMNDYLVIAVGGGGIPVMRNERGELKGTYAVIDKDRASSLLAQTLRADLFIISTGVEKVALNYNKANMQVLDQMTLTEAKRYMDEGHFAPGSMLPKIEAAVEFVRMGGPQAIITDPPNLARALRGETGTRIIPG
ncbi:MAG: carbamate kinase [Chloroflexi bacterium]|uniref:carbamate kinase n=1 Tax=Candidatus Flexifilum breve TaxID=3140694 RepID=UPI00313714CB|nr:carbamate kinase [Chloroflexota bacterium]